MKIEKYILEEILGWKYCGQFSQLPKSVIVFAPHTSCIDAFYGTLCFRSIGINYMIMSKKELFFFPMSIVMRLMNCVPVRGVKGHNAIRKACSVINSSDSIHIVICPEGTRKPVEKWNPGFWYIASRADVPIVVAYLDYEKCEYGVKGVIDSDLGVAFSFARMNCYYQDVKAYHPEKFLLPKISN